MGIAIRPRKMLFEARIRCANGSNARGCEQGREMGDFGVRKLPTWRDGIAAPRGRKGDQGGKIMP